MNMSRQKAVSHKIFHAELVEKQVMVVGRRYQVRGVPL